MNKVRVVFWSHWIICGIAHLLGPLCVIALVRWMLGNSSLNFWDMCLVLGANYAGAVFIVNHISNPQGFCSLTSLEAHYREQLDLPKNSAGFLPRFYTKCKQILKGNFTEIPL